MNRYRDRELTPIEIAAIERDLEKLNEGIFSSETEIRAAISKPGYFAEGPMGRLYRNAFEQKAARTQEAGFRIEGDNKASNIYPATAQRAGAVRNPDGTIDLGIID